MREFFISFRSRSEAMSFYESLLSYRIACRLINTPSSAGIGCGLSVKLFARDMPQAKKVLERGKFNSAVGFYYFSTNGSAIRV
ncbi:MAG: DUF3343 domain-containing protein [Clostridia bacterium]|nr:DUF3343 domain-containing protein [Clostridia bacterium]